MVETIYTIFVGSTIPAAAPIPTVGSALAKSKIRKPLPIATASGVRFLSSCSLLALLHHCSGLSSHQAAGLDLPKSRGISERSGTVPNQIMEIGNLKRFPHNISVERFHEPYVPAQPTQSAPALCTLTRLSANHHQHMCAASAWNAQGMDSDLLPPSLGP